MNYLTFINTTFICAVRQKILYFRKLLKTFNQEFQIQVSEIRQLHWY